MGRWRTTLGAPATALIVVAGGGATYALGIPATVASALTAEAADPFDCSGFPEKRVWLENQAWVDNQPGGGPHGGTQGHIHIGTCYPLWQTITGATGTVAFDVYAQLHELDGVARRLRVLPYQNGVSGPTQEIPLNWTCAEDDCSRWIHVDFDLATVQKSGWSEIGLWLDVTLPFGLEAAWMQNWFNYNNWDVFFANGKPAGGQPQGGLGGQSWLAPSVSHPDGPGSEYASARMERSSVPWDPATGQLIPVSGTWTPTVTFQPSWETSARTGKAMIDPALHANPPREGTVVYNGAAGEHTLSIDTTQLTNGMHRLLLVGTTTHTTGLLVNGQPPKTAGVAVIPFLVENEAPTPTTTIPTTTTPTTTTTPCDP